MFADNSALAGGYLRIKHIGEENRPVGDLVVTDSEKIAEHFKGAFIVRPFIVETSLYAELRTLLVAQAAASKSKPDNTAAFGTCAFGEFTDGHSVKSEFLTTRNQALGILKQIRQTTERYQGNARLVENLNGMIASLVQGL